MSVQEPIKSFLTDIEVSKANNTYMTRRSDMRKFNQYLEENDLDVLEAKTRHLHNWLRSQQSEFSASTVQSRYHSLNQLYSYLSGILDQIDENPADGLNSVSEYASNGTLKHRGDSLSYVTPDEVALMAEGVDKPMIRNELLIRLLFQTGMRRGELQSAKVENIDRESRSIRIYAPKTDDHRTVFYRESLDFLLSQWLDVYREGQKKAVTSPYLFPTNSSEHISKERINRVVRAAAENAGIQEVVHHDAKGHPRYRVTAHALRHGHAVHALKSGVDIRSVAEHMGHNDIQTTMNYLQFVDDDVEEAYEQNWVTS